MVDSESDDSVIRDSEQEDDIDREQQKRITPLGLINKAVEEGGIEAKDKLPVDQ